MGYQQLLPFANDCNEPDPFDDASAPPTSSEVDQMIHHIAVAQALAHLRRAGVYVPRPDTFHGASL